MKIVSSQFLCNLIIQVTLIFIFLTGFFFTYAKDKEKDVVVNNVDKLLESVIGETTLKLIPKDVKDTLKTNISNLEETSDAVKQQDKDVEKNNNQVLSKTVNLLIKVAIFSAVIVLICFYMSKKTDIGFFKHLDLKKIIIEALVILFFVGLTEFVFLTYFAADFISIEPNLIKYTFLKEINDFIKS